MKIFRMNILILVIGVGALFGCTTTDSPLNTALLNVVSFQYDHVANTQEISFRRPPVNSFNSVSTAPNRRGFWAVFVLCSLDVQGKAIETFQYDASKFVIEYEGTTYGPLQPFEVVFGASPILNDASNTPLIAAAIAQEVQVGPSHQPFPRGFYPSLNYRIAILIPDALSSYRGEQLTLKYIGQPSISLGRGQRPTNINDIGSGPLGEQAPSECRPPAIN